jgi:hypothetical protein
VLGLTLKCVADDTMTTFWAVQGFVYSLTITLPRINKIMVARSGEMAMSTIEIHLRPGKPNAREALRCLAGYFYYRKNGFKIFVVQLGDVTLLVWVPP